MDDPLKVVWTICRYIMAALACWWLLWFFMLIGESAEKSKELAVTAFGKAIVCGGAAAIWFYRARKAQQAQKLVEYTVKARQSIAPVQINMSQPSARTEQSQVIPPPEPPQDSHLSAVAHSPQTAREPEEIIKMICHECGKDSADDFAYCPYCGTAFISTPSAIEPPSPSPEIKSASEESTDQSAPTTGSRTDKTKDIGTYVFGAFAVIALLVSIIKGIVPIYLIESAVWAGAAWYWHTKKTHSELAKAIVIVLAALIAIGEVIQIARQFSKPSTAPASQSTDPFEKYVVPGGNSSAPDYSTYGTADQKQAGTSAATDIAEIEQQAVALYKQKRYVDARSLFDQACNGGEMKACNYLGYLYAKGLGGTRDTKKAREVYQRACDQGVLSSCASLGSLYQDAGNSDEARKYFNKACQGGVTEACGLLRGVE